jgi:hypothetical protein
VPEQPPRTTEDGHVGPVVAILGGFAGLRLVGVDVVEVAPA